MYENTLHFIRKVNKYMNLQKVKKIAEDLKKKPQGGQDQPEEHMHTNMKIMQFLAN